MVGNAVVFPGVGFYICLSDRISLYAPHSGRFCLTNLVDYRSLTSSNWWQPL